MGSVSARGGKIFLDFRYQGVRCREYTKLDDSPVNRKRANQIIDRIEAEITLNTFDYAKYFPKSKRAAKFAEHNKLRERVNSETPTLSEFSVIWFTENEVTWRFSHRESVELILKKYLRPHFGETPLDKITKPEILSFRGNLTRKPRKNGKVGLSSSRINKIMLILGQILQEGSERFTFVSPFRGIKPLKIPKSHIQPFTLEQVNTLIETVRPDYRNYFIVRFFTGMRTAEVDGLKWQYVDFERREILIRETWTASRPEYTKNDSSQREIQMSQPVYEALLHQKKVSGDGAYVFASRNGTPFCNRNFTNRVWYPLLRYLEYEKRRPYQTRHTAATLWLAAGEAPEWIARQMGHTSTEMLFTVYSRYVPNLTRRDGSAFENLLLQRLPGLASGIGQDQFETGNGAAPNDEDATHE